MGFKHITKRLDENSISNSLIASRNNVFVSRTNTANLSLRVVRFTSDGWSPLLTHQM